MFKRRIFFGFYLVLHLALELHLYNALAAIISPTFCFMKILINSVLKFSFFLRDEVRLALARLSGRV